MSWWRRPDPDAAQAKQEAEADLQVIRARWPEVEEIRESLREHQRRNHFADLITEALRGN